MVDTLWGVHIKVSYIKQATIRNTSYVIDLLGDVTLEIIQLLMLGTLEAG